MKSGQDKVLHDLKKVFQDASNFGLVHLWAMQSLINPLPTVQVSIAADQEKEIQVRIRVTFEWVLIFWNFMCNNVPWYLCWIGYTPEFKVRWLGGFDSELLQ